MNLDDQILETEKTISVHKILKANATATLLKIKADGILNDHQSKTDALLVLLSGEISYEEASRTVKLSQPHDFVAIPEKVTHRLIGQKDALLLLIQ